MGLLAVDVTAHGVVMSADSQMVEIVGGAVRVLPGPRSRDPLIVRRTGGFVGLIGSAGTETVEGRPTADWLKSFGAAHAADDIATFCLRLADALTGVWQRDRRSSVLEILVAGEVEGDVRFMYVRNSRGLTPAGFHDAPSDTFLSENDLDNNYIPRDAGPGMTKEDVLAARMYSFRQGVLVPASPVFDGFAQVMEVVYTARLPGFAMLGSLDDVGHYARVRMEFLKRLCTAKYGVYAPGVPSPVGGVVHVLGVGRSGEVRSYPKGRDDVRTMFPARGASPVVGIVS